jgi:hypothetical protein
MKFHKLVGMERRGDAWVLQCEFLEGGESQSHFLKLQQQEEPTAKQIDFEAWSFSERHASRPDPRASAMDITSVAVPLLPSNSGFKAWWRRLWARIWRRG